MSPDRHINQIHLTLSLHMRKNFIGVSLGRCHDASFVSSTSLAEHMGSLVPLLLADSVGGFRLCALMRTLRNIPQVEFLFTLLMNQCFSFFLPGLLCGTAVSVGLLMLDFRFGQSSFTEVIRYI